MQKFWGFVVFLLLSFFSIAQSDEIPVILIHKSNSDYLQHSLWQARQYNQRVLLLGDESNVGQTDAEHHMISDYHEEAEGFAKIYKHKSTNGYQYELFCFQRWFILKKFMEVNDLQRVFYCDSDVMLYCNVSEEYGNYSNCDLALFHWSGAASGHCSYFSIDQIRSFCEYQTYFYLNFEDYENKYPHISDMFVFKAYIIERGISTCDLETPINNTAFDPIIVSGAGPGYQMRDGMKDIQWENNQPHCYNQKIEKTIRFKGLHFQGRAKQYMKYNRRENPSNVCVHAMVST